MSDDIKYIKIGGISPSGYIRGIKNGNIDPSFDNAVKALLWAADEIERLRAEVGRLNIEPARCNHWPGQVRCGVCGMSEG
jgi:hypothetical protein